jgi:serine/threonine protein kinase
VSDMLSINDVVEINRRQHSVMRCIPGGKTAEVYRVRADQQTLALKVFKEYMSYDALAQLMQNPYRLRNVHSNILPIYDYDVIEVPAKQKEQQSLDRRGCLTMRYIANTPKGRTLEQFWRAHNVRFVPMKTAIDVMQQVCGAVVAAHDLGIVHGKLTLQNVLLEYGDDDEVRALVSDFALAEYFGLQELISVQEHANVIFKPPELPPEFLSVPFSKKADVWAIGVMLYVLLTDTQPYPGIETQPYPGIELTFYDPTRAENTPPPLPLRSPRSITDRVDSHLNSIVVKALAWNPEDRYANVNEIKKELLECR